MSATKALLRAELLLRAERHRAHARNVLAALGRATRGDRIRRVGHGTERTTAREWRRVKRHLRLARRAERGVQ